MRITILYLLICSGITAFAQSPFPVIEVVSAPVAPRKIGPCEPSIAINLKNPNNLVIGTVLNGYHYSFDGGKTWQNRILTSPYGVWGDPVVISDTNGHFHYFHLSDPTGKNWKSDSILDRIVCQTSVDGGQTWSDGAYMGLDHPRQQDKEWACLDPKNNNIYVSWTQFDKYKSIDPNHKSHIMFSRSTDGAQNWSEAKQVSVRGGGCMDDSRTAEGAVPAVGPNGEVYIAWARNDSLWFTSSSDQGHTFHPETLIATQPGGWSFSLPGIRRSNGFPVVVVDRSHSANHGTIYINWSDQREGHTEVWFSASDDGGTTWRTPQKISADTSKTHRFFTWMNIDQQNGNLYAVYYDRRAYDDARTDVYLAWSKDGGHNWKEKRISEKPFSPSTRFFFGDYNHIDALHGKIYPVWTAMEEDKLKIYISIIDEEKLD